jgi:hypothetical protein
MPMLLDGLKNMTAPQKAQLYYQLRDDKELRDYLISNDNLYKELASRDKAFADGVIQLTTRQDLSLRLKKRRDAL